MQQVIVEIKNDNGLRILKDLENANIIKLIITEGKNFNSIDWSKKYKGIMQKQSVSDIDTQLNDLRTSWE